MRWSRLRKWTLAAGAVSGVLFGTQTLGGCPLIREGESGLRWSERQSRNSRTLRFGVDLGTVVAKLAMNVVAPVAIDTVLAGFERRPRFRIQQDHSPDRLRWHLAMPVPAVDDSSLGMVEWVTDESLTVTFAGRNPGSTSPLVVTDWQFATKDHKDSRLMADERRRWRYVYGVLLVLSLVGVAGPILWPEKKGFDTESVVRELIDLVEGKNALSTRRIRHLLTSILIDRVGYVRALKRLGITSFAQSRSIARQAFGGFVEVAAPLRSQLDDALQRLEASRLL